MTSTELREARRLYLFGAFVIMAVGAGKRSIMEFENRVANSLLYCIGLMALLGKWA
jgi:hypothetical protein